MYRRNVSPHDITSQIYLKIRRRNIALTTFAPKNRFSSASESKLFVSTANKFLPEI
jgi:hypothetical protein